MACEKRLRIGVTRSALLGVLASASLLVVNSCGSAAKDEPGRCKQVNGSDYVAGGTDTDGKKWTFEAFPTEVKVRCNSSSEVGQVIITGIIRDSLGTAKAGLVIRPNLSGAGTGKAPSIALNQALSDLSTDACGVSEFTIDWRCPSTNKEVSAIFQGFSGPLPSNAVQVTVSNVVVANAQSATGGAPAAGAPAAGGTTAPDAAPITAPPAAPVK